MTLISLTWDFQSHHLCWFSDASCELRPDYPVSCPGLRLKHTCPAHVLWMDLGPTLKVTCFLKGPLIWQFYLVSSLVFGPVFCCSLPDPWINSVPGSSPCFVWERCWTLLSAHWQIHFGWQGHCPLSAQNTPDCSSLRGGPAFCASL